MFHRVHRPRKLDIRQRLGTFMGHSSDNAYQRFLGTSIKANRPNNDVQVHPTGAHKILKLEPLHPEVCAQRVVRPPNVHRR
jgi:hypothetical protein